jgi:hypothetical protein
VCRQGARSEGRGRRRGKSRERDASQGTQRRRTSWATGRVQLLQSQRPRLAGDLRGNGEGRGEEIQSESADWFSPRGVRSCEPSDWWRESSRLTSHCRLTIGQ